ncbi:MAG: hypothetical protein HFI33_02725 [Lachnospiraceae bacterium]|nr:hypothetical protein [Lachnospiraceae bacterium]
MLINNNYIDELKYSIGGENFKVNEYITVYSPYVYEVRDFGENLYHYVLSLFVRRPYDIAVELYDKDIDYQSVSDWDIFFETATKIPIELSCILFGKLNFTDFVPCLNNENGYKCLVNKHNNKICIDEVIYRKIVTFLRYIHFISEKVEYDVGNSMAKKFLIDRMRRKRNKLTNEFASGKKKSNSNISDMIKYCVNNSNFKYDYHSVMNMKLNLLYESYLFITHNNERDNIMSGIYHGTIDSTKMKDKSILNIIPDLHK